MDAVFEVKVEFVILAGTCGEVMARVVGMFRARVVDVFERRTEYVVLTGVGVVVIERVGWDSVLPAVIDDSKAVVIKALGTFVVVGPSVVIPL